MYKYLAHNTGETYHRKTELGITAGIKLGRANRLARLPTRRRGEMHEQAELPNPIRGETSGQENLRQLFTAVT